MLVIVIFLYVPDGSTVNKVLKSWPHALVESKTAKFSHQLIQHGKTSGENPKRLTIWKFYSNFWVVHAWAHMHIRVVLKDECHGNALRAHIGILLVNVLL